MHHRSERRQGRQPRGWTIRSWGRAAELAELDRQLELAKGGHGRVVLLAGPAGIGKTALVRRCHVGRRRSGDRGGLRRHPYRGVRRGPAHGRRVRVPYSVVYGLRDEQISALRIYFPMSLLIEQLTS